ncbi:hypothetical protein OAD66_06290 [Bacteroidia bacterium]|nr:hypothetical protein [Bacteroidia bacterium]MDB9882728.1 hypothetical protein [Bacteroidia bacterium]
MSQAGQVVGSDINYVKTGSTYTFTLTIYRDCRGVTLNNQYIYVHNGNTSKAIQVTLQSIEHLEETLVVLTLIEICYHLKWKIL